MHIVGRLTDPQPLPSGGGAPPFRPWRWLEEAARNLRHGARRLRQNPSFAVASIATLALCIGANSAIFSVVDAVLLRPLPYPRPDRLAEVATDLRGGGVEELDNSQSGIAYRLLREHAPALDCAAFFDEPAGINLVAQGKPEYVQQQRVAAGFFRVLGVAPRLGREFTVEEDRVGGAAVAVLGDGVWRHAFHADPAVLGRAVLLRGEPHTIVGVMPAGFHSGVRADVWTPLRPSESGEGADNNYGILARLRPGASWTAAAAQADSLTRAATANLRLPKTTVAHLRLIPLQQGLTLQLRLPVLLLWAAVGLVLLIGCFNVAGLLLAHAGGRQREVATRLALGGGRLAVLRQMLTESLLLAACGGVAGAGVGAVGLRGLQWLARDSFDIAQPIRLDGRVLVATACLALLTSLLVGLVPAWRASATDLRSALVESGGYGAAGGRRRWPRRLLVLVEVALGVVLLVGAGLVLHSFARLRQLSPGFDPTHVLTARLSLQDARYRTSGQVNRLFGESLRRIRELPGVDAAAVSLGLPYERLLRMPARRLDGPHPPGAEGKRSVRLSYVTPDFFATLRVPLLRGRDFRAGDRAGAALVAIVNRAFARKYLPEQEAVGSHIEVAGEAREIVGMVGDVPQKPEWGPYGPLETLPAAFIPATQATDDLLQLVHTWFSPDWVVRTSGSASGAEAGVRRAVAAVDPLLPVASFRSMDEVRAGALAGPRFAAVLLAALSGLALLLAAVGLYGLIAQAVVERTRELGIRMALGATIAQAMRAVALPGIVLAAGGVVLGCLLAPLAVKLAMHAVWGVDAADPVTLVTVPIALMVVAAFASLVPALRVARLDPARALAP